MKSVFLLTGSVVVGVAASIAQTAAPANAGKPAISVAKPVVPAASVSASSKPLQSGMDPKARQYYRLIWGVDDMGVKSVESGEMIRFSYTIVDATKAAQLNDKKSEPALIDAPRGVSLVVPALEKVGQLRQTGAPEAGRAYWMVFSNKGVVVKPGDRVSVVIGKFHVDGLVVQ